MKERLVVFGATGTTGGYVVRQGLDQGLVVRAVARDPNKVSTSLSGEAGLEVIEADVADAGAVDRALAGADMAFVAVGYKGRRQLLVPFVQALTRGMRVHGVGRLMYQASAMSAAPGEPVSPLVGLVRPVVGALLRTASLWEEHDAVIRFLSEEASDLAWTVTRAGRLKDEASRGALVPRTRPGGAIANRDLAAFSLSSLLEGANTRACPYLSYAS